MRRKDENQNLSGLGSSLVENDLKGSFMRIFIFSKLFLRHLTRKIVKIKNAENKRLLREKKRTNERGHQREVLNYTQTVFVGVGDDGVGDFN